MIINKLLYNIMLAKVANNENKYGIKKWEEIVDVDGSKCID